MPLGPRAAAAAPTQSVAAAVPQLVALHHRRLVRWAKRYVHHAGIAEEAVQEAWIVLITKACTLREPWALEAWLFAVVGRCARRAARREGHQESLATELAHETGEASVDEASRCAAPSAERPDRALLAKELYERFRCALERVPPRQQRAFLMREVDGCDAQEVASVLGISRENQRVLVHRARCHLRRQLADLADH